MEFRDNTVTRWRHALHSADAHIVKAHNNRISHFFGSGMVIKNSKTPAEATRNGIFHRSQGASAGDHRGSGQGERQSGSATQGREKIERFLIIFGFWVVFPSRGGRAAEWSSFWSMTWDGRI